jgi:hypothetical protein
VGQANGNAAALPYVAETLRNNPSVYPTSEVFRRLSFPRTKPLTKMPATYVAGIVCVEPLNRECL